MNFSSITDWVLLLLPAATGYATSLGCHVGKDSATSVNARPPSYVFSIVWPILYIFLGISWVLLKDYPVANVLFVLNLLGMMAWIIIYGCAKKKKAALYILLITLVLSLMLWGIAARTSQTAMLLLTPYTGWLVFALLLNYSEVNNM